MHAANNFLRGIVSGLKVGDVMRCPFEIEIRESSEPFLARTAHVSKRVAKYFHLFFGDGPPGEIERAVSAAWIIVLVIR